MAAKSRQTAKLLTFQFQTRKWTSLACKHIWKHWKWILPFLVFYLNKEFHFISSLLQFGSCLASEVVEKPLLQRPLLLVQGSVASPGCFISDYLIGGGSGVSLHGKMFWARKSIIITVKSSQQFYECKIARECTFSTPASILAWLSTFGVPKTVHSAWCANSTKLFPNPWKL